MIPYFRHVLPNTVPNAVYNREDRTTASLTPSATLKKTMTLPIADIDWKMAWEGIKTTGLLAFLGVLAKTLLVDRRRAVDTGTIGKDTLKYSEAAAVRQEVSKTMEFVFEEIHRKEDSAQGRETAMQMQISSLEKQMQDMVVKYTEQLGVLRLEHSKEIAGYQQQLMQKELEHIRVVTELEIKNMELLYKVENMEKKLPKRYDDVTTDEFKEVLP